MTTYHVWLTGHDQPEVVRADDMREVEGVLTFLTRQSNGAYTVRRFWRAEWHRWSVVHDEADHVHI